MERPSRNGSDSPLERETRLIHYPRGIPHAVGLGVFVAALNLTFPQGATWTLSLTWNDDDGDPINLTGYSAAMQVRQTYKSTTPVVSVSSGSGITLGGAAGTIELRVPATTTNSIKAGRYVYDLELISAGGEVTRLLEGTVTVTPEVTR